MALREPTPSLALWEGKAYFGVLELRETATHAELCFLCFCYSHRILITFGSSTLVDPIQPLSMWARWQKRVVPKHTLQLNPPHKEQGVALYYFGLRRSELNPQGTCWFSGHQLCGFGNEPEGKPVQETTSWMVQFGVIPIHFLRTSVLNRSGQIKQVAHVCGFRLVELILTPLQKLK